MPASGQGRNAVDALMAGLEANRAHPIMIHRLDAPIIVDGQVVDAVWDKIEPLPMALHTPTCLAPLTERTEVRIAHDDRYLWYSGACSIRTRPGSARTPSTATSTAAMI